MKTQSLHRILASAGLLAATFLAGCKTTMNTVERAQPTGQRQMIADKRVITDAGLARKVHVVGVNEATTPGGMLQVQVEVVNHTNSRQRFNFAFQWFDANGMQVNSTTPAVILCTLEGRESRFLSTVAPTPACRDFRLQFLESPR